MTAGEEVTLQSPVLETNWQFGGTRQIYTMTQN